MKPKLPSAMEDLLPDYILWCIYNYVPHTKRIKKAHSPSLQKELTRIQTISLHGKSGMYMRGLNAFCLD